MCTEMHNSYDLLLMEPEGDGVMGKLYSFLGSVIIQNE